MSGGAFAASAPSVESAARLEPGDIVLVRSVHRGRVRWAVPHRYVATDEGRIVLYRAPGARGKAMGRDADGRYLERWVGEDEPRDLTWAHTHVLQFVRPGESYTVEIFWDEEWELLGWYVNLQDPLRRTSLGFDTMDHALDVWVHPDGTAEWKDERDFAEAIALGVFDGAAAAAVRAEGERVIAARPWPTGWEAWRPPDGWTAPDLPAGWNAAAPRDSDDEVGVRLLTAADGMVLKDVRRRALRADPESFTVTLEEVERLSDDEWVAWASRVADPDADEALFVAFGSDPTRAIGMAGVVLRGAPHDDSRIYGVWVDPSVRGRGIARRLMHHAIEWAEAAGRSRMTLCVMETSVSAVQLYRSIGFADEGCSAPSAVHEGASELAMVLDLPSAALGARRDGGRVDERPRDNSLG